jgi:hypothetical protein
MVKLLELSDLQLRSLM